MKLTYTLLAVALVVVNAGADETSSNTRHNLNNRPYGSGGRPVNGQVGVGQFGTLGGRPVVGQIGSGQLGGFPQGVSPPLIAAPQRPDCKFFKRGPYGNYICDVDQKPFECPLVRFECPRFGVPIGPQKCYNDNDCYGNDKCCRDACFNHLICKGPE